MAAPPSAVLASAARPSCRITLRRVNFMCMLVPLLLVVGIVVPSRYELMDAGRRTSRRPISLDVWRQHRGFGDVGAVGSEEPGLIGWRKLERLFGGDFADHRPQRQTPGAEPGGHYRIGRAARPPDDR